SASTASSTCRGSSPNATKLTPAGAMVNPPAALISASTARPAQAAASAAAASVSSRRTDHRGCPRITSARQARTAATHTSGSTPVTTTVLPAIPPAASSSATAGGTYQRRGARSTSSQVPSTSATVPT